jgi:hypothetical protein
MQIVCGQSHGTIGRRGAMNLWLVKKRIAPTSLVSMMPEGQVAIGTQFLNLKEVFC